MRHFKLLIVGLAFLTFAASQTQDSVAATDNSDSFFRQIDKSSKLLLCSGNPNRDELAKKYPNAIYEENNEDWFTVDNDPVMNPDYLADLGEEETYRHLSENQYEIIVDEFCPIGVIEQIRKHAPKLLRKGGLLVSKVCAPFRDLKKIKKKMLQNGFSKVIFATIPPGDPYWQKKASPDQILEVFQRHEAKVPSTRLCNLPGTQWYEFVAVK